MSRPRPRPLRTRRRHRGPAAAASVLMTVALLGAAATTAQAADPAPSSSVPTQAAEHPAVETSVTGAFVVEPGRPIVVGTPVTFTYRWKNTGDVPLKGLREELAVGATYEWIENQTVAPEDLVLGVVRTAGDEGTLRTPAGATVPYSIAEYFLRIPGAGPQPSVAVEHPGITITVTGRFDLRPGETVSVETPLHIFRHVVNTGDVPLVIEGMLLQPGHSVDLPLIADASPEQLKQGFVQVEGSLGRVPTPTGFYTTPSYSVRIPIPGATLTVDSGPPAPAPTVAPSPTTVPTPTSAPSAGPVVEHPGMTITVTGKFLIKPGETVQVGIPVQYTLHVANTGDVPLTLAGTRIEPGRSTDVVQNRTVTQQDLDRGYAETAGSFGRIPTPTGSYASPDYSYRLPIPAVTPTPAPTPTPTATPTPTPTPTPTSTPTPTPTHAVEHPAVPGLAGRVAGSPALAPGEKPRIGTRVTWTVTVTNTGDVELQDVRLRGGKERVFLAPGETRTLTRSTTLSAHDLETRRVSSITQVSGRTPEGALVHLEVRGARLIRLP
ncbi:MULTISPECIES: hypothetical protein [unclassified Rathayibacter]|uniref:DUF7507 domain-containing protein n=1 Tax=unclassified Rathayibacter TaxID=2609250 RepID=UPI001048FA43|nr:MULTISPECIES: hypothetical protein [unclassified Rathayibacter]TCL85772.1 putative repeat protein (TIGR01451 family) [Rathayibacter sp. PhB192]TCM31593.1 putative repeat protein (TIGR01451 family) [Rathayibacter sp. PhB179]